MPMQEGWGYVERVNSIMVGVATLLALIVLVHMTLARTKSKVLLEAANFG